MGFDLNPLHSSYFTGAGLPWGEGPQDPYQPKNTYKAFDPNAYQGFDSSALSKAMRQDIGSTTARAKGRLQGTLQRGGGGGADAISGLAGLEAEQGQQENTLTAQLARQDWEDRLHQWQSEMEAAQNDENRKAAQDAERYNREEKNRNAPLEFAGQMVGMGVGGLAGAGGSALGAKMFGDAAKSTRTPYKPYRQTY